MSGGVAHEPVFEDHLVSQLQSCIYECNLSSWLAKPVLHSHLMARQNVSQQDRIVCKSSPHSVSLTDYIFNQSWTAGEKSH